MARSFALQLRRRAEIQQASNMDNRRADVDEASVCELARLIGDHFHYVEGRGRNCKVECLKSAQDYSFGVRPESNAAHQRP